MKKFSRFDQVILALGLAVLLAAGALGALSADRSTSRQAGDMVAVPVYTGTVIYAGGMVCVSTSDGYARMCTDASSTLFVGVAAEHIAAADVTSSGAKSVNVWRHGRFKFTATGITQAMVGQTMYVKADNEFDNTSSNYVICGRLDKFVSTTSGWIDISTAQYTGASFAASSVDGADAGDYFPATTNTIEEQVQDLATGPYIFTLPRFTGWTKDGTAKAIATLPAFEFSSPMKLKRAYCSVLTAPGSEKTLTLAWGDSAGVIGSIAGATVKSESEALAIAVPKNTDIAIYATETSSGAGANVDCIFELYRDDGE